MISHVAEVDLTTAARRLERIFSQYRFPGPFSVELTGAVMRQASFIGKMVALGWTDEQHFAHDKTPLLRAIARYHAFLDLMTANTAATVVPTLVSDNLTQGLSDGLTPCRTLTCLGTHTSSKPKAIGAL
jgi:hypothetical protein